MYAWAKEESVRIIRANAEHSVPFAIGCVMIIFFFPAVRFGGAGITLELNDDTSPLLCGYGHFRTG